MDVQDFMPGEEVVARIKGDIAAYEAERRQVRRSMLWRVPVFPGAVLLGVAAVALMFNILADPKEQWLSAPHLFLYCVGIIAVFFAYWQAVRPARRLTRSFRETVLSSVFGFIDQLRYKHGEKPQTFERLPQEVTGKFTQPRFGDMISGRYEGFGFEFYEATLARSSRKNAEPAFKGVVVAFGAASPFPGLLVASPRARAVLGFVRKLFGARIDGLRSGIDKLDARYDFATDNVAAARPLVTGRLAQALLWLIEAWPDRPARVALSREICFLLIPLKNDFFRLPPISRPLDYTKHIAPMIADLGALLATASLVRKISVADEVQTVPEPTQAQ